jgi:hypothetical protein
MTGAQGWQPQPEKTELYAATIPRKYKTQLNDLPFDVDKSVFPFRALAELLKGSEHVQSGRLGALAQGNYGSCTGFAGARAADITAACDIVKRRENERWPAGDDGEPILTSPDYVYAASRTVSGQLGRWQGSYGGAVAKALREYGAIHQQRYGRYDLSSYSINKCRQWASRGVPEPLIEQARKHPFLTTVRVESVEQAVALTQNGYGFFICCHLAWSSTRDDDGFCRRVRPPWSHAQAAGLGYVSIKRGRRVRRGFLIQNSWGPAWPGGPTGDVADMPAGAYFIAWHDMASAIASRDCYALADYQGFQERYNFTEIGW